MPNGFLTDAARYATVRCGDLAWDAWVDGRADGHILQTAGWGQLKQRFGWRMRRVTLVDAQGQIAAGAQMLLRSTAGLKLGYIPRGPLTAWDDRELTGTLLDSLRAEAQATGAALIKIEPELADTPENRMLLHSYGFTPSRQTIQPPSTVTVDIAGGEDAILQRMKSKWRYNIRLAERKGVSVRPMVPADLPTFNQLMTTTGARDGFAVHSPGYFAAAYDLLTPKHAEFLLAEYAGHAIAAIAVAIAGERACYLWGASSDQERNRMPNYALQWAGMQWARARGATIYDLWGIPDAIGLAAAALHGGNGSGIEVDALPIDLEALPSGGLWGVYRFKQGFGGPIVRCIGAWDLPVNPIGYTVYQMALTLRERVAELRNAAQPAHQNGSTLAVAEAQGGQCAVTAEAWRSVLAGHAVPHVLQSWEWGEIKRQTGWHAEHRVLDTVAGKAAFQFLWRQPIDGIPLRVAYVPKGPVLDWSNQELVDLTLASIEDFARDLGCIFVKIDPDVRDDEPAGHLVLHALARRGWRYSADQIQFKNTAYSDLTLSEDALLAGMKSKWRYNVRLAQKRGITVRIGTEHDLPSFHQLYAETGARDGFLIRPFEYYRTTWQTFLAAQADLGNPAGGALLLADHPDDAEPVAGLFLMRYAQRTWYFYGASSERQRRDMPNYLLQWEALRWAKGQGCTVYDWWGAPTRLDDEQDGLQGVWQFKQGFGAEFQSHIGAWDYMVAPVQYQLYTEAMPAVLRVLRKLNS